MATDPLLANLSCCGGDTVPNASAPKSAVSGHSVNGPAALLTLPRNAATSATSAGVSSDLRKPIAPTFVSAFWSTSGASAALRMLLWLAPGSGPWQLKQLGAEGSRMYSWAPRAAS